MPIGTMAAVSALAPVAIKAGQALLDNKKKGLGAFGGMNSAQRNKEHLLGGLDDMRKGNLGLSTGEKNQQAEEAMQGAGQQVGQQQREMQRDAMARGGRAGGAEQAQARELGQEAAAAGGEAYSEANELSGKLAAKQQKEILARLDKQQDRARSNGRYWGTTGINLGLASPALTTTITQLLGLDPETTAGAMGKMEELLGGQGVDATGAPEAAEDTTTIEGEELAGSEMVDDSGLTPEERLELGETAGVARNPTDDPLPALSGSSSGMSREGYLNAMRALGIDTGGI